MEDSLNKLNEKSAIAHDPKKVNNNLKSNNNMATKEESSKNFKIRGHNRNLSCKALNKELSNNKKDLVIDILSPQPSRKINFNSNNSENIDLNINNLYKKKKRLSQKNLSYLNRFIDYEKKKTEKITEMKKEIDEKEKEQLKKKPSISRKSVELISKIHLKDNFFERMEQEDKKAKEKKQKLIEKINNERNKKKEEIEKPLEFNIVHTPMDKRFNKVYQEMVKKDEDVKEKINIFSDVIKQYEMRECSFQPKINRDEKNNNKKEKRNSNEIIERLYNDDIKDKEIKRENLEKKYQLSFKPKLNEKSLEMAKKRKKSVNYENKEINKNKDIKKNNDKKNNNKKELNKTSNDQKKKNNEKEKGLKNKNIIEINNIGINKENSKNIDNL